MYVPVGDMNKKNKISMLHFNTLYHASFIILYNDQQMHNYFNKLSHSYMFPSNWTILRELMMSLAKATILWN